MGFLTEAVAGVRASLRAEPLPAIRSDADAVGADATVAAETPQRDFASALRAPGISLIAEVKRASPSAGAIAEADAAELAAAYERAGASALSVLTEATYFGGSIQDLVAARAAVNLPILRKDFIVDASQIAQARAAGADAVLLIAAALDRHELADLSAAAAGYGLQALVEAHSPDDVERALGTGARIVGVNSRDLETLEVDLERALSLLPSLPAGVIRVLESGVATRRDVQRAEEAGADAVLVGEALMRAPEPEAKLRELLDR